MWQGLKRLLSKPRASDEWRGCATYVRDGDGTIFIFAQARLAEAKATVTYAFVGSIALSAGGEAIGRELLRGLEAYDPAIPDEKGYAAPKTVPAAAGFKSWRQLETTTRHLAIASNGKSARVTPYKVHADGGLEPISDQLHTCPSEPRAIGELFLGVLEQMPR
jgi:hypothetical protein